MRTEEIISSIGQMNGFDIESAVVKVQECTERVKTR